jgi:hypothetical protein
LLFQLSIDEICEVPVNDITGFVESYGYYQAVTVSSFASDLLLDMMT